MKTIILFIVFVLPVPISAFNIAEVAVSSYSEKEINIRLTTEAIELYYFQSWQYTISGNTIIIDACFIPGFGSTIAYLNNEFQIPINTTEPQGYHLIVNAYYNFYTPENLQDSKEGMFVTPITDTVLLTNDAFSNEVFSPNPTTGKLFFDDQIKAIWIFDITGKHTDSFMVENGVVDLSSKPESLYIIGYLQKNTFKTFRIILRR